MSTQSSTPPLPSSYVDAIKESCRVLRDTQAIQVSDDAVKRLLFSPSFLHTFKRVSGNHGLHFPLKFPSVLAELNFLSILCLLNFASGYRVPLHEQTGRGAWDNIRALVFGMYLSTATGQDDLLAAKGMRAVTRQQIAELMRVKIYVERSHETLPGITVGELGGPMYDLVKLISATLNETGEILERSGVPDLGSFVLRSLTSKRAGGRDVTVDDVLDDLVCAFPAFRDMAVVDGRPVYCFKKALFLIYGLTVRFGSSSPPPFPLPDTRNAPVFADNVLPSMLVHLGVLDLSRAKDVALRNIFPDAANDNRIDALLAAPGHTGTALAPGTKPKVVAPKEGPILTSDQAYILRATSVDACEKIIKYANQLDESSLADGEGWIKGITRPELNIRIARYNLLLRGYIDLEPGMGAPWKWDGGTLAAAIGDEISIAGTGRITLKASVDQLRSVGYTHSIQIK